MTNTINPASANTGNPQVSVLRNFRQFQKPPTNEFKKPTEPTATDLRNSRTPVLRKLRNFETPSMSKSAGNAPVVPPKPSMAKSVTASPPVQKLETSEDDNARVSETRLVSLDDGVLSVEATIILD